ncbi:UNVERIFIED_ORG: putative (di)nucleoside polyphosphate hydrolase [Methylobacterium sp. SuP10 SLI 274]|uniref:RNA pyrophosphohydrolase n=1 Tax=Methylorubrum extorquens TaxID=408 RepID=UPI0020A19F5C|nr:RNA pyrophosphohydrolase [Methylorubrum extorquens]MDF9865453.1 putative (di)nucleoside polyphosphate hydrolase [Methylorubrum pseudosasae]MDH6639023.1 putative (di)nucleoside polyphosphate hydrolase [Methylobacterium sp. SuP10 SLI 274]MDH6668211.1 putative (di)nucleoside polyphosphate hydrolase [Methylorubrum zatmanii]MCP1560099.1 putative (di)nucleoside polyphosphate hydrolase [Methylorubrum extorquens]MDF9793754.1 putative (di)nucleoside polyphosphate hydrolase [Methylorubrum extorquens]
MTRLDDDLLRLPEGSALPYRPCVGVTLFHRDGRVFIGRRKREAGPEHVDGDLAWQMPQGGIDEGEEPLAAALRELHEETNVPADAVTLLGETRDWLAYDLPPAVMKQAWKGRYRGQRQKWFAFGLTGDESAIDVDAPGGGHHKPEFEAWRWERLEALPDLIVPFKRPVYEGVVAAFSGLTGWHGAGDNGTGDNPA